MAEVYNFLECEIKRCGSVAGGTTEYSIDAYAEELSVSVSRDLADRADTSGVIQQRIPVKSQVEMQISKLYQADFSLFDGNDIKLYMGNTLGTETWKATKCYWQNKGWSGGAGDDGLRYEVSITASTFGTV